MKKLLLLLMILFSTFGLQADEIDGVKPSFNKIYRSDRIGDSYHFLLLTKKNEYYYLFTNKTDKLTSSELTSSKLLKILKEKQSWGKAFHKSGKFTIKKDKLYTNLLWDKIEILSSKEIKYLNKTFYLQ